LLKIAVHRVSFLSEHIVPKIAAFVADDSWKGIRGADIPRQTDFKKDAKTRPGKLAASSWPFPHPYPKTVEWVLKKNRFARAPLAPDIFSASLCGGTSCTHLSKKTSFRLYIVQDSLFYTIYSFTDTRFSNGKIALDEGWSLGTTMPDRSL
jgi:hypothetical protein